MPNERPGWFRFALGAITLPLLLSSLGCSTPIGGKKSKSFRDRVYESLQSTLNSSYQDPLAAEKMAEAEELFASQRYAEARKLFGQLADNKYNPGQMLEKARFLEAESARLQSLYPEAVATYHKYLQDHIGGVYSRQAADRMYAIAEIWLKDTMKDLDEAKAGKSFIALPKMPNFSDPTKPKLDQEGQLVKTLENIAEGAPHAECAEKAMFWAGYIHYSRGRYEDADHYFSTLAEQYKDSPLRAEAVRYAIDAKNRSVGGPWYDGQKSAEALQLVHNLEASQPEYRKEGEKQEWITKQKLSIREGQAERDFESAEYFRRTDRLGSAYFYYELVKRRYPGTQFSDRAIKRLEEIKQTQAKRDEDKANGKVTPLEAVQNGVGRMFGAKPRAEGEPTAEPLRGGPKDKAPPVVQAGGTDGR